MFSSFIAVFYLATYQVLQGEVLKLGLPNVSMNGKFNIESIVDVDCSCAIHLVLLYLSCNI